MVSMSATAFRKELYSTIELVNANCEPVVITNSKGKGAVLIGEDDWASIEETLHLASIPGMTESLLEGRFEAVEDCSLEADLDW